MNRTALPRLLLSLTLLLALLSVTALVHAAPDAAFDKALQQFGRASGGDHAAIEPAADAFAALLKAEPANPVLLAYTGAATTMKAVTALDPMKKMEFAEDGLAQLDKALALLTPVHDKPLQHGTPGTLEVKFVAANTFLAVPPFMNRAARGHKLLNEVLASPLLAGAPQGFRDAVHKRAAQDQAAPK
jgi:hypothetical protein